MKEDPNIDELLNSFLDGELSHRQHTEVQRMAAHDKDIAERLRRFERCKMLVSSLPYAEAPAGMVENIKASLEKRSLPVVQPIGFKVDEGARHLLVRRLVAAAAMVGLVAVLAAVIYSILSPPETATDKPIALKARPQPMVNVQPTESPAGKMANAEKSPDKVDPAVAEFSARLELETSDFVATDKFVRTVIENNGLLNQAPSPMSRDDKSVYLITCSREDLNLLLADLENIWTAFGSATLFVNTDRPNGRVVVHKVTTDQIWEITDQYDFQGRVKAAKYFAVLNNITGTPLDKEPFTSPDSRVPDLTAIPRPVLTSSEETVKRPADQAHVPVSLTIMGTSVEGDN